MNKYFDASTINGRANVSKIIVYIYHCPIIAIEGGQSYLWFNIWNHLIFSTEESGAENDIR